MQIQTPAYYKQKVEDILNYIHAHLSADLNIKQLSEQFGISFFHFHRIVKAYLKEPLGSYINRARLETAVKLIRYSDEKLSDIAVRIGYNDVSAFSKAFTKEFGISPNEFKADNDLILNTHIDYRVNEKNRLESNVKHKIKTLSDRSVYFIRVKGKYGGKEVSEAWNELGDFIRQNNLVGWNPEIFSIYYDDSEVVGFENTISDVCITSHKSIPLTGNIKTKKIPGGRYAVFRFKGPYEHLWELYDSIYNDWLFKGNFKLREEPVIEKYITYSPKTKSENFLTEIFIPIEK